MAPGADEPGTGVAAALKRAVRQWWLRLPRPAVGVEPGLYHYTREQDGQITRFHLRVEPDGSGLLLANAANAGTLSGAGTLIAKRILEGSGDTHIMRALAAQFRGASRERMGADVAEVRRLIEDLLRPGDNYPITNLDDPYLAPRQAQLGAPYRADVTQAEPEQLAPIIARLWEVGIPHVTFDAQLDRSPQELVRLVQMAADTEMIAGVWATGGWLGGESILHDLAMAGVDHLTLLYASADADVHDGIAGKGDHEAAEAAFAKCHEWEVCPVARVPLVAETAPGVRQVCRRLGERGVTNLTFYAIADPSASLTAGEGEPTDGALAGRMLPQVAAEVIEASEEEDVRFLWEPPVRRDSSKRLAEQIIAGPRAAGDVAIRVEPDGSVFPARGPRTCAGNLLRDDWATIWGSDCFTRYRERAEAATRCPECPDLVICAADCPMDPRGWSDDREGGEA